MGLISDDYGNVAKKAEAALEAFAASQAGLPGERALIQILEENLHNLATSLPRRIKMSGQCCVVQAGEGGSAFICSRLE